MFWLFLPHLSGAGPELLKAVGLGELLAPGDDAPLFGSLTAPGPGGLPGVIVCWQPSSPHFQPELQDWQPAVPDPVRKLPAGRYWWGRPIDVELTPAALARKEVFPGVGALRTDAGEWRIPNVQDLPSRIVLDATSGKFAKTPREDFAEWRQLAERGLQLVLDGLQGGAVPEFEQSCELALQLLQLNYRLTRETAIASGLLSFEEAVQQTLMMAAGNIDQLREEMEAWRKKARPAASGA